MKKRNPKPETEKAPQQPGSLPPCFEGLRPVQIAYLAAFMELGEIVASAKAVGISHSDHYYWLNYQANEEARKAYGEAWKFAKRIGYQKLVAEAHRRAVDGCAKYKFTAKGEAVMWTNPVTGEREHYQEREYSDFCLGKLLEAHCPEEFRPPQKHEHTGEIGIVRVKLDRDREDKRT